MVANLVWLILIGYTYKKNGKQVHYYDSFGDLSPPRGLVAYLHRGDRTVNINYNYNRHENFDSVCRGHHCLEFLLNSNDDDDNNDDRPFKKA